MTEPNARWQRIRTIFADLVDLEPAEQQARLAEYTTADANLRAEVEALLEADRKAGDSLSRPDFRLSHLESLTPTIGPGSRIGAYQVVREIGRGGMGTVYEATRVDGEYSKRVALKMIPPSSTSEGALRRFRHERQILARLEHKNIAALIDGGVAPDGSPFFAMEFVEGERIDRWCERQRLGVRQRLQLFRQVCSAVHYAHQNLVVHRDLKPANVLVRADGTVKLLDFGIAKLVDPTEDSEGLTQTGAHPMTTAYASPEQLRGEPVGTASDVYSLGVLLYLLLAGRPPFVDATLPVLELRRRTLDTAPMPPSEAATANAAATSEGSPARLRRSLAGELDNIVLKALRKEAERRYTSAQQFGDDLLRFLSGLPVEAQPDSFGYRAGKFVRRNVAPVAAGTIAILALAGGTAVSLWQSRQATADRVRAELARETATQVTAFFKSVLTTAKPTEMGREVTVTEAIDSTLARFDTAFRTSPGLRAAIAGSLGSTLYEMGRHDRAEPLLRGAHEYYRRRDGQEISLEGAEAAYNYAGALWTAGRLAEAESLFRRSLSTYQRLGESATNLARGYNDLAQLLDDRGDRQGAIAMSENVLASLARDTNAAEALALARSNHATYLAQASRYAEAVVMLRQAAADLSRIRGPDNERVGAVLQPLAFALMVLGEYQGADSAARRSLAIREAALGRSDPRTLSTVRTLAEIAVERGTVDAALPLIGEVIERGGASGRDNATEVAAAYLLLARARLAQGRPQDALDAAQEARRLRVPVFGEAHWLVSVADNVIGATLAGLGRRQEARALLAESTRKLEQALGPAHMRTKEARGRLATFERTQPAAKP